MNWKNLMKTATLLFVALFAFAACSDDKEDPKPKAEDAALLTFGFYQEDNAGVLSKDYVAQVPAVSATATTYNIEIPMPSVVDKSALVARFTVTEGNTIVAAGVAQVSQTTANDFTVPVDYTVSNSDKTQNLRYTVTVTKSTNMAWTEIPFDNNIQSYDNARLVISPKDNTPFMVYRDKEEGFMKVLKFDGTSWSAVGDASALPKLANNYYSMDIALDGTIYVVYNDADATNKNGLSVKKFDGSAWSYVGEQGFTKTTAQYVGIMALQNGPVAFQQNTGRNGDFPRRAIVGSVFSNGSWNSREIPAEGFTGSTTSSVNNGVVGYVYALNSTNSKYSIVKYDANGWSTLVSDMLQEGATHTDLIGARLAIAPDGTLYLLNCDDADENNTYRARLLKYDASANTWTVVSGNSLGYTSYSSTTSAIYLDVAIAPDGTPFVAFADNTADNVPTVVAFDNETKQWGTPVQVATVSSKLIFMKFTSTGTAFMSVLDSDNHIHVYKYAEK